MNKGTVLKLMAVSATALLLVQCVDGDYAMFEDSYEQQTGYQPEGVQTQADFEQPAVEGVIVVDEQVPSYDPLGL